LTQYLQKEPGLKPYVFSIERILRTKAHILPADQEKIYSYSGLFSGTPAKAAGILNNVEIPSPGITLSNGKKITLNLANYVRYRSVKNRSDRALVMKTYWKNHKKFENTFAALLDGAMKQHLFNARIHKYSDTLEARLSQNNIDPRVYQKLIRSVRENLGPLHRYLKVKQELLGLDQFKYEDIYASAVKSIEKIYTFEEAQQILLDMMKVLGKDYSAGLLKAFKNRWIDRYPNKNKESGYYCSSVYGVHPYIKMNYNGTYETVSLLAHELGHALHSYFANRAQHFVNSQYSNFLAEIASTFNESVLVDYLLKHETDDLFKLYILDAFLQQVKGTVYRQVHFAEFELAMHRQVEAGKTLTADWLNKKYLELARYYYGHDKGITEVGDYIQNEWAGIPHFFLNYYVYTYSTGMISSTALAQMVLTGSKTEREKYLDFLKAGGSNYSLEILKQAGVDITTDKPYQMAFQRFNRLVSEMEKIVRKLKKNKKL
jgi:oligoendopeptidase F